MKRLARDESGNVVVEFALIGVLFFFLLGMAIQGAFLFNNWLVISDVANSAARYAAPCYGRSVSACSTTDITSYVTQHSSSLIDTSKLTTQVSSSGGLITVSLTYTVPLVAPMVDAVFPNPYQVVAKASMRLENGGT